MPSLYCLKQGSSGIAQNPSLIKLHLATGQTGKPGAGPFSLTGQPNTMGGREVGGPANLLSASRHVESRASRGSRCVDVASFLPGARRPELKRAAVTSLEVGLPWTLLCVAWPNGDDDLRARS